MLVMPPPLWTPRNRTVVRPSIPAHWRRGPRHKPHCPLYNMADGDASLNSSGDTILDSSGDEYLKCCCAQTCTSCMPPFGTGTATVTISGVVVVSGCNRDTSGNYWNLAGTCNGSYSVPISSCSGQISTGTPITGVDHSADSTCSNPGSSITSSSLRVDVSSSPSSVLVTHRSFTSGNVLSRQWTASLTTCTGLVCPPATTNNDPVFASKGTAVVTLAP